MAPDLDDKDAREIRRATELRHAETIGQLVDLRRRYGSDGNTWPWETTLTDEETHDARGE